MLFILRTRQPDLEPGQFVNGMHYFEGMVDNLILYVEHSQRGASHFQEIRRTGIQGEYSICKRPDLIAQFQQLGK